MLARSLSSCPNIATACTASKPHIQRVAVRRKWGPTRSGSVVLQRIRGLPEGYSLKASNAEDVLGKLQSKVYMDQAARRFAAGLDQGIDEDELTEMELGAFGSGELPEAVADYKDKIKERLVKRAEELKQEDETLKKKVAANLMLGKEAYERGQYQAAVRLLERSIEEVGESTSLGGEAQMWLALSYQACGREKESIQLFKYIESNHPNKRIQKQAESTRYILEAPKLPLGEDERVKIKLLNSDTWRASDRKTYTKPPAKSAGKTKSSYWDRALDPEPLVLPGSNKWYYQVLWACIILGSIYANWAHSQGQL